MGCGDLLKSTNNSITLTTTDVSTYTGTSLSCTGISAGASLNDVLLALDAAICAASTSGVTSSIDYDGSLTLGCITIPGSSDLNQVISAIATEICNTQTIITDLQCADISCTSSTDWQTIDDCLGGLGLNTSTTNVAEENQNIGLILQDYAARNCAQGVVDPNGNICFESKEHYYRYLKEQEKELYARESRVHIQENTSTNKVAAVMAVEQEEATYTGWVKEGDRYCTTGEETKTGEVFIVKQAEEINMVASKDNYIDYNVKTGLYEVQAVNIGAEEPAKIDDTRVRVAKVTTDLVEAVNIDTSVADTQPIGTREIARKSINSTHIADGTITGDALADSGVVAGTYEAGSVTINEKGIITSATSSFDLATPVEGSILTYSSVSSKYENEYS
jgi:hypothetical protein